MTGNTLRGMKDQPHYTIVVLGDVKSGKTAFVTQCIFDCMKTNYKATIEDCYRTLVRLPDGRYKTVNLVDTAGTMEFPAMRELRIRSATVAVIVYDVTNPDSVNTVSTLKKQIQQIREYDGVPIAVIGNTRGQSNNTLNYQIPVGIMDDSTCEHFYIDLSNNTECKRVYNTMIEKCYESSTWKIEVWNKKEDDHSRKRRGLFSYLSFRFKSKKRPQVHTRATRSLP